MPSLRHNLIPVFRLLPFGYDVTFKNSSCSANLQGELVGSDLLVDCLFSLTLSASYDQFLSDVSSSHNVLFTSIKRCRIFL